VILGFTEALRRIKSCLVTNHEIDLYLPGNHKTASMKKKLLFFITLIFFSGLIITPSCKTADPTFGTLTITAYDPASGAIMPNVQINLAYSLSNLKDKVYYRSAWTNDKGQVYFGDLAPLFYFYNAEGYDDYGAVQIYAGNDFYVHYYPNTIHQGGK
jgi:hypothetical protein